MINREGAEHSLKDLLDHMLSRNQLQSELHVGVALEHFDKLSRPLVPKHKGFNPSPVHPLGDPDLTERAARVRPLLQQASSLIHSTNLEQAVPVVREALEIWRGPIGTVS